MQLLLSSQSKIDKFTRWWREKDSNLRTHKRADLQSAAFNHSAIPPQILKIQLADYLIEKHLVIKQFLIISKLIIQNLLDFNIIITNFF